MLLSLLYTRSFCFTTISSRPSVSRTLLSRKTTPKKAKAAAKDPKPAKASAEKPSKASGKAKPKSDAPKKAPAKSKDAKAEKARNRLILMSSWHRYFLRNFKLPAACVRCLPPKTVLWIETRVVPEMSLAIKTWHFKSQDLVSNTALK